MIRIDQIKCFKAQVNSGLLKSTTHSRQIQVNLIEALSGLCFIFCAVNYITSYILFDCANCLNTIRWWFPSGLGFTELFWCYASMNGSLGGGGLHVTYPVGPITGLGTTKARKFVIIGMSYANWWKKIWMNHIAI